MTKAVILDIDGTLADATHRLHHIEAKPPNWDAFFAECVNDPLIEPNGYDPKRCALSICP